MAKTKKEDTTVTTKGEEPTVDKTVKPRAIKPPEPEERVEVMIHADPSIQGADAEQEFFSVNFNDYMLKTDEVVRVPKPLKEVIDRREEAKIEARHYARAHSFKEPK